MSDLYLAGRLQSLAQHEYSAAVNTLQHGSHRTSSPASCILLAQALYHSLVGLAALRIQVDGDLDGERESLVTIARTLAAENVRAFTAWEIELVAALDIFHMRPVSSVLLPNEFVSGIFSTTNGFVERLVGELFVLTEAAKEKTG